MKTTPGINNSIVDNCIILPLCVTLLIFEIALILVRQAGGNPITWHSVLRIILAIILIIQQSLMLRKKLALRKENEEGGNDEYDSRR